MTIRLIQGFEQILPTTVLQAQVLPTELREFLGFTLPANTTDWFLNAVGAVDDTSGPMIIDSDFRIDGQCLRIKRPNSGATYNPSYNGAYAMDLTRNLTNVTRCGIGLAVKYDAAPAASIPLIQWRTDNTVTEFEQTSLWLSPTGIIFFSTTDMNLATASTIAATPVAGAVSQRGTFNFTEWQYIEVDLDYTGAIPSAIVYINGQEVINIQANGLAKGGFGYVSSVSVINPQNTYFTGDSCTMYIDDLYIQDGAVPALGPQHIVLLEPDATTQAEFVITGGEATSNLAVDGLFDKSTLTDYITNDASNDQEIFTLANVPASILNVTAVSVGAIANVDTGTSRVRLQTINGANVNRVNWAVSSLTPFYLFGIFETAPDDTAWTVAKLNDASLGLEVY